MVTSRCLAFSTAALAMVCLGSVSVDAAGAQPQTSVGAQPQTSVGAQPQTRSATAGSSQRAVLDEFCVRCHNTRRLVAGLALDTVDVDDVGTDAEVWEKVLRKLHARAMPPAGSPRPDDEGYASLVSHLETAIDRAAALDPDPGRPGSFHRLNRTEYQHVIRDLLALEVDVTAWLPGDDAAYGFDNNAGVLSMSPALLDAYLSAASKISRLAVGDLSAGPDVTSFRFSKAQLQEARIAGLPFGSRGGAAVRHYFPLDGEYVLKVSLAGPRPQSEQIAVRLDGTPVAELAADARPTFLGETVDTEVRITATAGPHTVGVVLHKRMLAPEGRFPAYFPWANSAVFATTTGSSQYLHIDGLEITGPFAPTGVGDTPSRRRIFTCRPTAVGDEPGCAEEILGALARRAYRRPATDDDLETLLGFYREARTDGGDFDAGVRVALTRLLVDPDFLYRTEVDPAGAPGRPYQLGDLELASRLSFFLWSSIPDDELLALAERNQLRDPAVFERQVRRLLADERSTALVTSFAAQWLFLRNVRMASPDLFEFPEWDDDLRAAMSRETELFLEHQIRENRPVGELLTADHTYVNERLARHYGIDGVYGSHFRRIDLADDRRAGLLGHASILTVTSFPQPDVPGGARQVAAREPAGHAAAGAAARRARAARERAGRVTTVDP